MQLLRSNMDKLKLNLMFLAALFVIYSGMLPFTFTSDHIGAGELGKKPENFLSYLQGGRPVSYIYRWISYWLKQVHVTELENQIVLKISMLVFLSIGLSILYRIFERYVNTKMLLFVSLLIITANPFLNEMMLYSGWTIGFGFLTTVWAVTATRKKHFFIAAMLCFWSISTYQIFLFVYLIFLMGWEYLDYLKSRDTKMYVVHIAWSFLVGGVSAAFNLITSYIAIVCNWVAYADNTIDEGISIWYRFYKWCSKYYWIGKSGCGVIGSYVLLIISFGLAIMLFALVVVKKNRGLVVISAFSCLCVNLYTTGIYFATPSEDTVSRIVWPFFAMLGMEMIWILRLVDDKEKRVQKFVLVCFLVILITDLYYTENAIVKVRVSNSLDRQIISQVEAAIERYEDETGCTVVYVAAKTAEGANPSWPQIDSGTYNYAHKTVYDDWANVELLNFLTERNYEEIDFPDSIAEGDFFRGKAWDTFIADEQLLFDGDTLYWMIY